MTAQPNQGFIFAAPAAFEIRRRSSHPVDVATHMVAVFRAGGGAYVESGMGRRSTRNDFAERVVKDMRSRSNAESR